MPEQIRFESIKQFNDLYGFANLHPLVSVGRYDGAPNTGVTTYQYDIYAIFIKETKGCSLNYGLTRYDFDEMSVVSFAPGQKVTSIVEPDTPNIKWTVLAFHPDFLSSTGLGKKMSGYEFFSYNSNEALHLSEEEVKTINSVISLIEHEMQHAIDRHSRNIIVSNIEVFLDYCMRFYERQFITREVINNTVIEKFQQMLMGYIANKAEHEGLPSVAYFADRLNLSPGYFGELVKTATGQTAKDFISNCMVNAARELLNEMSLNISQVSYRLGFDYPQHFVRFFKRRTGKTPKEYRNTAN